MMFNENSRVKIPAIIQLTRLWYGYLSIKQPENRSQIDPETNIFKRIFVDSLIRINSTNTPPSTSLADKVKDGKIQRTILKPEEEHKIINAFMSDKPIDDFSVIVSYDEIKGKNYVFTKIC